MKEENKYYSPEISEFFVGFEVEVNHRIRNGSGERSWCKEKFRMSEENIRFTKYLLENEPENIRVKHLDKDDIKELGFTETNSLGNLNWGFIIKEYNQRIHPDVGHRYWNIYLNYYPDRKTLIVQADVDGEKEKFFEGIIKNKSELKQLIDKQLNINSTK